MLIEDYPAKTPGLAKKRVPRWVAIFGHPENRQGSVAMTVRFDEATSLWRVVPMAPSSRTARERRGGMEEMLALRNGVSRFQLRWQGINLHGLFPRSPGARISPQVPMRTDLVEHEQAYR